MNRRQTIIWGAIFAMLLGLLLLMYWLRERTNQQLEAGPSTPVLALAYCNEDQVKPCVVSFGVDSDDNVLVNLLIPDLSFPRFYLKVIRGEEDLTYECHRIPATQNNVYCFGEKLSPGEVLHLMLISIQGDMLLAEGDSSIIGMAFPTLGVVTPTQTLSPTVEFPILTQTLTPGKLTPSQPSYPNRSYP